MNVSLDNRESFGREVKETACFYFCDHFYKAFKDKVKVRGASVLKQTPSKEVIAYCSDCRKQIFRYLGNINTLSTEIFSEARKLLIQYFLIIDYSEKFFLLNIRVDDASE